LAVGFKKGEGSDGIALDFEEAIGGYGKGIFSEIGENGGGGRDMESVGAAAGGSDGRAGGE
jgi:hypothetical protein